MNKVKFNTYNDGILSFGEYIESYDINGNATDKKEFTALGKLFFSYQVIREQDKLKFDDTGKKISIKIKVPYMTQINSSNIIKINNELYSIGYIDTDVYKHSIYIYLTELQNELNTHIELYKQIRKSALENKTLEFYKKVWAKVEDIQDNSIVRDMSQRVKHRKKVTIRYLDDLDINIYKKVTVDYKVKYKDIYYNIDQVINVEEENKLFEITIERIY